MGFKNETERPLITHILRDRLVPVSDRWISLVLMTYSWVANRPNEDAHAAECVFEKYCLYVSSLNCLLKHSV